MIANAKLLSGKRRQRLRNKVKEIAKRRLALIGDDCKCDEAWQEEFTRSCVQELKANDRECKSFGLSILLWILQAAVMHLVREWLERRGK